MTSAFRGHTGLWVAPKELGKFSVGDKEENSTLALLRVSGKMTQGNLIPGLLGTQEVIKAKGSVHIEPRMVVFIEDRLRHG